MSGDAPADPGELVRGILDAVPGGVVHVARDGSILSANREALRILGWRFDELTRRYVEDFAPETILEDGSPCPAAEYPVSKVLATGEPQPPVTIGVRKPDGATSWAVFRAVPVRDPSGALTGAVVTFLDITERKRTEEELRQSEEKWRLLAENLPDFVVVVDRAGRIRSINRLVAGLSEAEVIGRPSSDFVDRDFVGEYEAALARAVETRTPTRMDVRGAGAHGELRWYESVFVPLVEAGEVARVLIVASDVTERRAMLASVAERERLASVGMVASSVAHEIMNPLTYMLANLDIAAGKRDLDGERRARAIAEAREGARRMQQIVWDLRALGRAGSEELFYVDARSVLETALRLSGPEVGRTASVRLDLAEVPPVLARESRLCQVFINLLVNAAQSMAERSPAERELHVRLRHDEARERVGVAVTDRGCGIAPERLTRIFDPFYTTKRAGT